MSDKEYKIDTMKNPESLKPLVTEIKLQTLAETIEHIRMLALHANANPRDSREAIRQIIQCTEPERPVEYADGEAE